MTMSFIYTLVRNCYKYIILYIHLRLEDVQNIYNTVLSCLVSSTSDTTTVDMDWTIDGLMTSYKDPEASSHRFIFVCLFFFYIH